MTLAPTDLDLPTLIRTQLDTIATTWAATATPMQHGHGSSSGRALPSSTITLRADITLTLAFWVHALVDEHPAAIQTLERVPVPTTSADPSDAWTTHLTTRTLDCTDIHAMTDLLHREAHRIATWGDYGYTLAAELQPLADHARLVAQPPRRDKLDLGPCPDCGRTVTAKAGRWVRLPIPTSNPDDLAPWTEYQPAHDQVITCRGCKRRETLTGWRDAIVRSQRGLSAEELVEEIHTWFGMRYSPITIRVWARRGFIRTKGYTRDGRAYYDRVQVFAALMDREATRRTA
jgi:hypothetical protein